MLDGAAAALSAGECPSVAGDGLDLRTWPTSNMVGLRARPASPGHLAASRALGLDLDGAVNRVTEAQGRAAMRLGPDEWLIATGAEQGAVVAAALGRALDGYHAAAIDLSDGISIFDVRGSKSIDVLRKGCGIDLHPTIFTGRCASRTILAQATVVLRCIDGPEAWRIHVDRSYESYMWAWLRDAGREYLEAPRPSLTGVSFEDTSV